MASRLVAILLMESALCWTRSFMTPMRSSLDCCSFVTASCRSCICVWSWTMSLLTAKAGAAVKVMAASSSGAAMRRRHGLSVYDDGTDLMGRLVMAIDLERLSVQSALTLWGVRAGL